MLYVWIVLQILLESLPVSSSGHVALVQKYLGDFSSLEMFQSQLWIIDFLLHGPMIILLFLFFFKRWWQMIFQIPLKSFRWNLFLQHSVFQRIMKLLVFGFIADGITVCFWLLDILPSISLTVGFSITAILLYLTRYCKEKSHVFDMNLRYAFLLGLGQSLSFLPGVSRFATTYSIGRFCGYSGQISFAVSFLIQFPLLVAAFVKGAVALHKNAQLMRNIFDFKVLFVILAASMMSYLLLWCVDAMIKKNKLWQFAWYMLMPIVLTLFV